jgi:hypothetical protein
MIFLSVLVLHEAPDREDVRKNSLLPVYLQVQKNRKVISKGRREIKPGLTFVEYYADMGYNDATLARLKKVGVDVEGFVYWSVRLLPTSNIDECSAERD